MHSENTDELWLNALSDLNEVQRRRFAALKALELGWGGVSKVSKLTKMSHHTIDKGIKEVTNLEKKPTHRLRCEGGGRKKVAQKNPQIQREIENIVNENTAGDPMSLLKWTSKSTYTIAKELNIQNYSISEDTVGRILKQSGYTLQGNRKSKESGSVPQRSTS